MRMNESGIDGRMVGDADETSIPMASKGAAEVKDFVSLRKDAATRNAAPAIEGGAAVEGDGGGSAIEDRAAFEEGVS